MLKVLGWVGIYSLQNERKKKQKKTFPVASRAPTSKKRSNELELGARKVLYIGPDVIPMQISNAALVYSIAPFYNNLFRRLAARRPVMSAAPGIEIPRGNEHFLFFLKKNKTKQKNTPFRKGEKLFITLARVVFSSPCMDEAGFQLTPQSSLSLFLSFFLFQCLVAGQAISIDWSLPKIKLGEIQTFFKEETARRRRTWKYIYKYMCTDISTCHIRPVIRTPESSREGGGGERNFVYCTLTFSLPLLCHPLPFIRTAQRFVIF